MGSGSGYASNDEKRKNCEAKFQKKTRLGQIIAVVWQLFLGKGVQFWVFFSFMFLNPHLLCGFVSESSHNADPDPITARKTAEADEKPLHLGK